MVDKVQMIGTAFLPMDRVNKKILVSKRSMNKKYFPGFWELLGGNLEFGEDFKDCVIREVKEEINCDIKGLEHLKEKICNRILNIKCINDKCNAELNDDFIEDIIKYDNKLYNKYNLFKNRISILNNKDYIPCPIPDCEGYAIKKSQKK